MRFIGRASQIPKGFEELTGGVHLGHGVWMLNLRKKEAQK